MKNLWNEYTDKFGATIFHPQFFMLRAIEDAVQTAIKYSNGDLIDLGCGRMQYRDRFEAHLKTYTGLDHPMTSKSYHGKYKPEVFADIHKIPLKNNSYDTAIMFQVVEYLDNPRKAFKEVGRIIKKDGILIISTPFMYPIHDRGIDKNRFTKVALKSMLEENKFKIVAIKEYGNLAQLITLFINTYCFKKINNTNKIVALFFLPFALTVSTLFNLLTIGFQTKNKSNYVINYTVVAMKLL